MATTRARATTREVDILQRSEGMSLAAVNLGFFLSLNDSKMMNI